MSNFWCNFLSIAIGLGSAILGGLIGWYLRRSQIEELESNIIELETNQMRLKNAHDTLTLRNSNLQEALYTTTESFNELETAQLKWQNQYDELNARYVARGKMAMDLENELATYIDQNKDLSLANARIPDLDLFVHRTDYETMKTNHEQLMVDCETLTGKYATLESEKAALLTNWHLERESMNASSSDWSSRYEEIESRLSSLTHRYLELNAQKDGLERTIEGLNNDLFVYRNRSNPDDLKIVEGIGPKIEELLNNAGIWKLQQLAIVETERIREILGEAGARFRMHDPQTWPEQASMAYQGEWAKLKEYQDYLMAAKDRPNDKDSREESKTIETAS